MDFALSEAQAEIRRQVAALARGFGWDYWREKDRKAELAAQSEPTKTPARTREPANA